MSATAIFDPLKARIIDEDSGKTLHLKKVCSDLTIHFPGTNPDILNSSMLRIHGDFNQKEIIGYGILAYEKNNTELDLYLNYNHPTRLDLENGSQKYLFVFFDVKTPYGSTLNATLDSQICMDTITDKLVFEFSLGKDSIVE